MTKVKKYWGIIASLFLVVVLMAGCTGSLGETANFRFLLSDDDSEFTAIGEFASVNITVSKIGFQRGGESGNWTEPEDFRAWTGDLLNLIGTNATVIWNGYVEPGYYTNAFIYVGNVTGTLTPEAGGGQADICISSDEFQITMPTLPFTVTEDSVIVDFVFDITIIKDAEGGQYLIMPRVDESGPDQEYREVNNEYQDDWAREMKFKGTILTIADNIWTVSLGDEVWTVNVTEAKIEGMPAVGLKAKIEGMVGEDDIILARDVEVEEV